MKYNPTQSATTHNPFKSALRAGKNIQRPAKSAEARCTYSSHSNNDTARPLTTTIAPTTGRGLISACSILTIKSQKSIRNDIEPAARAGTWCPSARGQTFSSDAHRDEESLKFKNDMIILTQND